MQQVTKEYITVHASSSSFAVKLFTNVHALFVERKERKNCGSNTGIMRIEFSERIIKKEKSSKN